MWVLWIIRTESHTYRINLRVGYLFMITMLTFNIDWCWCSARHSRGSECWHKTNGETLWLTTKSQKTEPGFMMIRTSGGTFHIYHYNDVILGTMASQITSLTIVYSTVYFRRRVNLYWPGSAKIICTKGEWRVTATFPPRKQVRSSHLLIMT